MTVVSGLESAWNVTNIVTRSFVELIWITPKLNHPRQCSTRAVYRVMEKKSCPLATFPRRLIDYFTTKFDSAGLTA